MIQLSAAAVRYRIAVGPQAGRKTMTLHSAEAQSDELPLGKAFTVARDGLSINCAVSCEANERGKLERLCRYMARPRRHLPISTGAARHRRKVMVFEQVTSIKASPGPLNLR